jgi:hypothetical protein
MRESNWKYREKERDERAENKKQLLGFEDVNFEQRREPYNERSPNMSNKPQHNADTQSEGRRR